MSVCVCVHTYTYTHTHTHTLTHTRAHLTQTISGKIYKKLVNRCLQRRELRTGGVGGKPRATDTLSYLNFELYMLPNFKFFNLNF